MKILSFDLEIEKEIPDGTDDFFSLAPLGITCAAAALTKPEIEKPFVDYWFGWPKLSKEEAGVIVHDLIRQVQQGWTIVTWNGAGFDFRVLAQESSMYDECAKIALNHVDLMLLVTFTKGWYLGLEKVLNYMIDSGKRKNVTLSDGTILDNMSGAMAPSLWKRGETKAVLAYLYDDVVQPWYLTQEIIRRKSIQWLSGKGRPMIVHIPKLLTVRECFDISEPDTSWMSDPPTRAQFIEWMPETQKKGIEI